MSSVEPKKYKFRKHHKGSFKLASRRVITNPSIIRGDGYVVMKETGLFKSSTRRYKTNRHKKKVVRITTSHKGTLIQKIKREIKASRSGARYWDNRSVYRPVTSKPIQSRMGGGKGAVDHYEDRVGKGAIILEVSNIENSDGILHGAQQSMPGKLAFVHLKDIGCTMFKDTRRKK